MSRRILVVDDSAFICQAVSIAFRDAGYDVDIATDLWAFEDGDSKKPDLVIMDVVLQEAYGDEVAELLRATRGLSCPIILFSALPESELADRTRDAGLDGYVTKRAGIPALVGRVNEILGDGKPVAAASEESLASFKVVARQRVRRVVHVLAQAAQWSAAAIAAEMQALSGDADLVGATEIAKAARACRETVINQGSAGWTPVIGAAINALTALVDDKQPRARKLLVIEDRDAIRELVPLFDAAGHVVFEAHSLAEARQKLRTTDYDAVLLDVDVEHGSGAQLIAEIRARMPTAKLAVVGGNDKAAGDAVIAREVGTSQIAQRVMTLLG